MPYIYFNERYEQEIASSHDSLKWENEWQTSTISAMKTCCLCAEALISAVGNEPIWLCLCSNDSHYPGSEWNRPEPDNYVMTLTKAACVIHPVFICFLQTLNVQGPVTVKRYQISKNFQAERSKMKETNIQQRRDYSYCHLKCGLYFAEWFLCCDCQSIKATAHHSSPGMAKIVSSSFRNCVTIKDCIGLQESRQ